MDRYDRWLKGLPAGSAARIDTFGRIISMLASGRMGLEQPRIASEAGYTLLNWLATYNDRLLHGHARWLALQRGAEETHRVRMVLTLMSGAEVAAEFWAAALGEGAKQQLIDVWEVIKAVLRLKLLIMSPDGRLQLRGGAYWRVTEDARPEGASWKGSRSGLKLPVRGRLEAIVRRLREDDEAAFRQQRSWRLLLKASFWRANQSEGLRILRPLVYLFLLRRLGKRSWLPLVISLALELSSLRAAAASAEAEEDDDIAEREGEELTRRRKLLALNLLRGRALDSVTQPLLDGVTSRLGKLGGFIASSVAFYTDSYFWTAGSS